jgi:hypothetical protein
MKSLLNGGYIKASMYHFYINIFLNMQKKKLKEIDNISMVQNKLIYGSWKEQKQTMKQLHKESLKKSNKRKNYPFGV